MLVVRSIADWRTHRERIRLGIRERKGECNSERTRECKGECNHDCKSECDRENSGRVGFVPTMGALHAGHISLVERARAECEMVVVSVFVNPTQFNNAADLSAYPRTESADAEKLIAAGADYLFVPTAQEMYPADFTTTIDVGRIAEPLEGATRGVGHFHGVATVVAKLFNIVQPDAAYFGQKDAQQLLVVKQLVRDLSMPIDIIGCDTVREADGLAMSSRNVRLSDTARAQAVGLSTALYVMRDLIANGARESASVLASGFAILASHGIGATAIDYLAVVAHDSLQSVDVVSGDTLIAVAAHVDGVRLIDNVSMRVPCVVKGDVDHGNRERTLDGRQCVEDRS